MKPVYLAFNGINSYNKVFEIDFYSLTKRGLFGIFGPTGSGKSTILDAITLALYGKISRYDGENAGISTNFLNTSSTQANVRFVFDLASETSTSRYEVIRNYKKKKDGTISIFFPRLAKLEYNNNFDKNDNPIEIIADHKAALVNSELVNLLGLSYDDFVRSIILPQSKFSEFMVLKGKERYEMMERLFNLQDYGKLLTDKINFATKTLESELDYVNKELARYTDISFELLTEKEQKFSNIKFNLKKLKENELDVEERFQYYNKLNSLLLEYNQSKIDYGVFILQHNIFKDKRQILEKAEKAAIVYPSIQRFINLTSNIEQSQQNLELKQEIMYKINNILSECEQKYGNTKQDKDEKYPKLLNDEQNLKSALNLVNQINTLKEQKEQSINEFRNCNNKIKNIKDELGNYNSKLDEKSKELKEISQKKSILNNNLNKKLSSFVNVKENIINDLKQELVATEFCPICGSPHSQAIHNNAKIKYKIADQIPNFEQNISKLKTILENKSNLEQDDIFIQESIEDLSKKIDELNKKLSYFETSKTAIVAVGKERANTLDNAQVQLLKITTVENIHQELEVIKNKIHSIIVNEKELYDTLEKHKIESQKAIDSFRVAKSEQEKLEGQLQEIKHTILKQCQGLGFKNKKEVVTSLLSENERDKLKNDIFIYDSNLQKCKNNIERLEPQLKNENKDEISIKYTNYQVKLKDVRQNILESERNLVLSSQEIKQMQNDLKYSNKLIEKSNFLTKKLYTTKDIAMLFRGDNFIKFLAKKHLKYIVTEASRRLKDMTFGQYTLECDENTNFIVRDNFAGGAIRPPRSFSGGESFMASLCLALALSTRIQMKNNLNLSFFFLDEGFGSLDKELLNKVTDTLEMLKEENIIVGLISHVEEMKHRIIDKIELKGRT